MSSYTKWSAHIVDLRTLFGEWERRRLAGYPRTRRFREIHSVCMFVLCLENGTDQRYLIGFPERGIQTVPATVNRLFDNDFGEIDDCDVVLVDDPKKLEECSVPHHRCQLVSYINQPSTSNVDVVKFLERKKLKVARDDDLRLVIHFEQEGYFNYEFLSLYLRFREPKCPYSQAFVLAQCREAPRAWFCAQIYPDLRVLPELSEDAARSLALDRQQYCKLQDRLAASG